MQDNDGLITEDDFVRGMSQFMDSNITAEAARELFQLHATSSDEQNKATAHNIDYNEFVALLDQSGLGQRHVRIPPSHRDEHGQIQIAPSREKYFGETLRKYNAGKKGNDMDFMVARSQEFAMQLYESRIASLQRFVAMTVLFHQMGTRVERFFEYISLGMWGYRTDRTHSIMRIATTASPVSGADVKQQMRRLRLQSRVQQAVHTISMAYLSYKARKQQAGMLQQLLLQSSSSLVPQQLRSSHGMTTMEDEEEEESDEIGTSFEIGSDHHAVALNNNGAAERRARGTGV
jgi:hypothetical protein